MRSFSAVLFSFFLVVCNSTAFGQTVINDYAEVTGVTANSVTVNAITDLETNAGTALQVGDVVYIMQMQGANYSGTNGSLAAINNAGLFERAEVASIASNTITLTGNLVNTYTVAGNVQLIRVPVFVNHTVPAGGYTAQAWDGSTGGVFAIEVTGSLTLSNDINVSEDGFRGGQALPSGSSVPTDNCFFGIVTGYHTGTGNFYDYPTNNLACEKGQGVAIVAANQDGGRAPITNAGGGGGYNTSGGGGGANYGAGGNGGRSNVSSAECSGDENGTFGIGGFALATNGYTPGNPRVFMGGGGGAGNNGTNSYDKCPACRGGRGGGVAFITAGTLISDGGSISANGESRPQTNLAGGGGGAAGTIILNVTNYDNSAGTITTSAQGGDGGTSRSIFSSINDNQQGGGGGGGGGFVWYQRGSTPTVADVNPSTAGGLSGFNSGGFGNGFSTNGSNGNTGDEFDMPGFADPLPVELLSFTAQKSTAGVDLKWTTTKEVNTSHFELERLSSAAATKTYTGIQTVAAIGENTNGASYTHTDSELPDARTLYYRLKVRDYDGQVSYSPVVQVTFDEIDEVKLTLAPNPVQANQQLNVNLQSSADGTAQIEVFDLTGRRHHVSQANTIAGSQTISIPTDDLETGVYLLRVTNNGAQTTSRFQVVPATR